MSIGANRLSILSSGLLGPSPLQPCLFQCRSRRVADLQSPQHSWTLPFSRQQFLEEGLVALTHKAYKVGSICQINFSLKQSVFLHLHQPPQYDPIGGLRGFFRTVELYHSVLHGCFAPLLGPDRPRQLFPILSGSLHGSLMAKG